MHPATVTPIMPKNTEVPKLWRSSKPEPVPKAKGTTPNMKAREVMAMGLSLFFEALLTALTSSSPCSSLCFANSTISIAFLQAKPIKTMNPICVIMLLSIPRACTPEIAKNNTRGTINITANGIVQLSYKADNIKNTKTTHTKNTISDMFPARFCWKAMSVHSIPIP